MPQEFIDNLDLNSPIRDAPNNYFKPNFASLKSSFSGETPPDNAVVGQTYFNTSTRSYFVCTAQATDTEEAVWELIKDLGASEEGGASEEDTAFTPLDNFDWTPFNFNFSTATPLAFSPTNTDLVLPEADYAVSVANNPSSTYTKDYEILVDFVIPTRFNPPTIYNNFSSNSVILMLGVKDTLDAEANSDVLLRKSVRSSIVNFVPFSSNQILTNVISFVPILVVSNSVINSPLLQGYGTIFIKGNSSIKFTFYNDGSFKGLVNTIYTSKHNRYLSSGGMFNHFISFFGGLGTQENVNVAGTIKRFAIMSPQLTPLSAHGEARVKASLFKV